MTSLLRPELLSLPLLGHPTLRQSFQDPQSWAEAVCVSTPVRICEPLRPSQPFLNESAVLQLGPLVVVATQGSPITLSTAHHPSAQLLIPYRGNGIWRLEREVYTNPLGESVLYLPAAPLHLENTVTSGVALNLDPAILLRTAMTMAGPEGLGPAQLAVFQQPRRLELGDRRTGRLIQGLYTSLMSLDLLTDPAGADRERLRLDDALTRLAVLLLLPELRPNGRGPRQEASSSWAARRKLEDLLGWIEANLDQPISVSDLEAHAHWSRRTLQQLFRQAHGCTPMQWVRCRRLHLALRRLKHPLPGETVASIARSSGFLSSATFHREFRRLFGCSPSSVLRG